MSSKLRAWSVGWYVALAGITGLSAILRFWQLGRQNLWLDELFTVSVTSGGFGNAWVSMASDTNPPAYFAIQSLLTPLLGRTEFAMRVFPAVTAILATVVIGLLGTRLFNGVVGLCAALLFAVAPYSVEYGQEARPYSLMMLMVALAMLAFVALVERPDRLRTVLFGVSLAGLAYTHVYGYLAVVAFAVPVLARPRLRARVGRPLVKAYFLTALLFLPWLLELPAQVQSVLDSSGSGSWWGEPVDEVITAFADRMMRLSPSEGAIAALLFAGLLLLGLPFHTRDHVCDEERPDRGGGVDEDDLSWMVLAVSILPVFAGVVISKYVAMVATHRNTLIALPGVLVLIARGGMRLSARAMMVALGALVAFSVYALPDVYASTEKGRWRDATEYVLESGLTSSVIAETYEGGLQYTVYAGLLGEKDLPPVMWTGSGDPEDWNPKLAQWDSDSGDMDLTDFLESRPKIVVIMPKGEMGPAENYFQEHEDEWTAVDTFDGGDPVVKIWTKKP